VTRYMNVQQCKRMTILDLNPGEWSPALKSSLVQNLFSVLTTYIYCNWKVIGIWAMSQNKLAV